MVSAMSNGLNIRRCWAEIDIARLCENMRICRSCLPSGMRAAAVVKADAYGHGDLECALAFERDGTDLFAVATLGEAIKLREGGVRGEILILGYTPVELWKKLVEYRLTQTLVSEEYAEMLFGAADEDTAKSRRIKCQFAVDTGMNRIGLDAEVPAECERAVRKYADIFELNGIFTHLCTADGESESEIAFTERQRELFEGVASRVEDLRLEYIHCMNSAGGLFHSHSKKFEFTGNVARFGIVLYGLLPDRSNVLPDGIKPVLTWKTVVAMVKTLDVCETVGYGRTFTADRKMKIATLAVGYADGYNRLLSNKGHVLINGKRARIVGRVCMDQMMVDVTDIDGVAMGDEVVLIGESGEESITADDMAEMIGTIGYEIVCNISPRVEMVYV